MNINTLRKIIRQESPARIEVGTVVSADYRGIRQVSVRLSGGRVASRLYMCPDDIQVGDMVIVAHLEGLDRMAILGRVLDQHSSSLSKYGILGPPANLTVTGFPMAVHCQWETTPSEDLVYIVEESDDAGATKTQMLVTRGSNYTHLCTASATHAPETWYFRVCAMRWLGDSNVQYSAWSAWSNASSKTWDSRYYCFDDQTEMLTAQGWKRYNELEIGEQVFTYNADTEMLEPDEILAVHVYDHNDDLIVAQNRMVSFAITPDHRVLRAACTGPSCPQSSPYRWIRAHELLTRTQHVLPATAPLSHDDCHDEFVGDAYELLGWFITDGCFKLNGNKTQRPSNISTITFSQKKEYGKSRIASLLDSLGICYSVHRRYDGNDTFYVHRKSFLQIEEKLPFSFAKSLDDIALDLPQYLFERLLAGLIGGDGTKNGAGWRFYNQDEALIDRVQAMCVLHGYRAIARYNHPTVIVLSISLRRTFTFKTERTLSTQHYTGPVWCATVNNGTLIVRRDGKPIILGNTEVELSSSSTDEGASLVWIEDPGDYFDPAVVDVEDALQALAAAGTPTALNEADIPVADASLEWQSQAISQDASLLASGVLTVEGIQGRNIADTAPTDGQALVWVAEANRWEPREVSGLSSSGGGGHWVFHVDGTLATGTQVGESIVAPEGAEVSEVYLYCEDTGTAGSTIVDLNINGTTMFTTQGNRPTVAWDNASKYASGETDITSIAVGDILTVDIDQVATDAKTATIVVAVASTSSGGCGAHTHTEDDITDLDHNAAKIQGRNVSDAAPSDADVLVWVASSDEWQPSEVSGIAYAQDTAIWVPDCPPVIVHNEDDEFTTTTAEWVVPSGWTEWDIGTGDDADEFDCCVKEWGLWMKMVRDGSGNNNVACGIYKPIPAADVAAEAFSIMGKVGFLRDYSKNVRVGLAIWDDNATVADRRFISVLLEYYNQNDRNTISGRYFTDYYSPTLQCGYFFVNTSTAYLRMRANVGAIWQFSLDWSTDGMGWQSVTIDNVLGTPTPAFVPGYMGIVMVANVDVDVRGFCQFFRYKSSFLDVYDMLMGDRVGLKRGS